MKRIITNELHESIIYTIVYYYYEDRFVKSEIVKKTPVNTESRDDFFRIDTPFELIIQHS